jgi:hypothetical protein
VMVWRNYGGRNRARDNESEILGRVLAASEAESQSESLAASEAWVEQRIANYQQIEMICGPTPSAFDTDESVIFVLPGVCLLEPRAIRHSSSTWGGPTIRIAKGLSYRLGAGTRQSESSEELREIDQGTLVLTTKRLAFMGALRTSNVTLDDIIAIKMYADGIRVHRERKQRAETYVLGETLQILEGSGKGLCTPMIIAAINFAKTAFETPAEVLAALEQEARIEHQPGTKPA